MSDRHVVAALQRSVADLELRLREVVRERDEAYDDRRRARAERDEARACLAFERVTVAELRAEAERLRAALRAVAERQREADTRNVCGDTCRRAIRRTPLVTEGEP